MSNPSQDPSVSSKAQYPDSKDKDVLCIFKTKEDSQNMDHGGIKDQIKIKTPNTSQELPESSNIPNEEFKDMMFFVP